MSLRHTLLLAAAVALAPVASHAQDLMSRSLTAPAADQWQSSGNGESHKLVKDDGVRGGWAYQVTAAKAGQNPWDVQANVSTDRPVKNGDVILLAFWAKAAPPPAGAAAISAPAAIQEAAAPYTRLGEANLSITPDWKLYYVAATATKDYVPQALNVSVQLAAAAQTVDLGPVFLLDYGPGYNLASLPVNDPEAARAAEEAAKTKKKK